MSDTPVTDALEAKMYGEGLARTFRTEYLFVAMADLERQLSAARARLEANATPYDGIATRDETIRLLEREVEGLKAAKVEGRLFYTEANAKRLIAIRDAFVFQDHDEAWHQLYSLATINCGDIFHPWEELEKLAVATAAPQRDEPPHPDVDLTVWLARKENKFARPIATLPNDHHPSPRCLCDVCQGIFPENMR